MDIEEIRETPINPKTNKTGCYMIIPKHNLIYPEIKNNLESKLIKLVDEIIRNVDSKIEVIDGLVAKSVLVTKYPPLSENEVIVTESLSNDEEFINNLYKVHSIKFNRTDKQNKPIFDYEFVTIKNSDKQK